jgi:hypothetical protein
MAWWDTTPTVMPSEPREWTEQRLREGATMAQIKIELRDLGWHNEADGTDNPNSTASTVPSPVSERSSAKPDN